MIGALIGDISGSRYERQNHKSKVFELFDGTCRPTDDSVMSLAVAKALLESREDYSDLEEHAVSCMQELGRMYPRAGYGRSFYSWIFAENPKPYESFGDGAGMRVGPCGFAAGSLEEAKLLSAEVTKVTHNHPEGMKGAEAVAVSVFLAKSGASKEEIRERIAVNYYALDFTIDGIRPAYRFDVTCQGAVPVALEAFLESSDFEDAIRTAISVGGDSDTIAAMAGAVAEAFYGVPAGIVNGAMRFLDKRQKKILFSFEKKYPSRLTDTKGNTIGTIADMAEERM